MNSYIDKESILILWQFPNNQVKVMKWLCSKYETEKGYHYTDGNTLGQGSATCGSLDVKLRLFSSICKYYLLYILVAANTYSCEQVFSCMNIIRSKVRSQLRNENLKLCLKLKTTSYEPHLSKLSKTMQSHRSHSIFLLKCMLLLFF